MEGVAVDWPNVAVSVALLGFVSPLSGAFWEKLPETNTEDKIRQMSALFKPWQNWLDLSRSAGGAYVLTRLALTADEKVPGASRTAFLIQAGILTLCLLPQIIRFHSRARLVGPIFYLSGLIPGMAGYIDGGFAVLVAWMFAFVGRSSLYFFLAMGVSLLAGAYIGGISLTLFLCAALSQSPLILGALFQQRLILVAKENPVTELS